MPSSQDGSPGPGPKSKQERIRDNQRRSRARRQEYLSDLEKRLRDCHTLCRDAEIQRSAYIDVQRENACLRTLLGLSGISTDLIESFIRQNASSHEQPQPTESGSSMRQLKPKLPVPQPQLSTGSSASSRASEDASTAATKSHPQASISSGVPRLYAPAPTYPATNNSILPDAAHAQLPEDFDWLFDQLPRLSPQSTQEADSPACCGKFIVPPNNIIYADDRNSVLCSVARTLLDQYNIPPQEMEGIKIRLASGFSKSANSRECRVNNHTLFQILNEISTKYG